ADAAVAAGAGVVVDEPALGRAATFAPVVDHRAAGLPGLAVAAHAAGPALAAAHRHRIEGDVGVDQHHGERAAALPAGLAAAAAPPPPPPPRPPPRPGAPRPRGPGLRWGPPGPPPPPRVRFGPRMPAAPVVPCHSRAAKLPGWSLAASPPLPLVPSPPVLPSL